MKFLKAFLPFSAFFISNAIAQQAICDFGIRFIGGESFYSCGLQIDNPNGIEITSIEGIHLQNFTDADVQGIYQIGGISTRIFLGVFCQRFPNIRRAALYSFGITELAAYSFVGCESLEWLSVYGNQISSINQNTFENNQNLTYLDLDSNQLTTLPEGLFANMNNLLHLDISFNPFTSIPGNIFNGLQNLNTLYMQNARITAINPSWFSSLTNLEHLYLSYNQISEIPENSFANLGNLVVLMLYNNNISDISNLRGLDNLRVLDLNTNNIRNLNENSFNGFDSLNFLGLNYNPITIIRNGTFRLLHNLQALEFAATGLREIESDVFGNLERLWYVDFNFNEIEDLPSGVFASLNQLRQVELRNNRLKTLRRDHFGPNITTIEIIDLEENVVNSLEISLFDDLTGLDLFLFGNNICASGVFGGFIQNRNEIMQRLDRCFRNFDLIIDAVTDNNVDYLFFRGENPGIVARVQAEDEIQIALTPFNFPWSPMIEVIIGAANNTRSIIRRNQDEDVAVVPSPGIIRSNQQNLFRIVWANHVILVFRENEQWPFLVHTMIDFFNVNFYGLRTLQSRATWSIQPIGD